MMTTSLSEYLDKCSKAYYDGNPILDDHVFDRLSDLIGYSKVGHKSGNVKHAYRMWSLQKVFEGEDSPPFQETDVIKTVKLDGAAISVLYVNGYYTLAITRGDGIAGLDITEKIRKFVPDYWPIMYNIPICQISMEVVAPSHIPNARNYASGALNLKSLEEFNSRELKCVAYDLQPTLHNYETTMKFLVLHGFNTVTQDWTGYPSDGYVVRINDNKKYESMGFTNHHPRGSYALKTRKKGEITTIKDVVWQVGKTGRVTPVAILEPVEIGGATVTKATLNNLGFIEQLDIDIGDKVEVIRSGEIIPMIVRKVT